MSIHDEGYSRNVLSALVWISSIVCSLQRKTWPTSAPNEFGPLVTHLKPLVTHLKPLVTHLKPLVTHLKPLVTHLKTLVTHLKPLVTHLKPLVTHLKPLVTHRKKKKFQVLKLISSILLLSTNKQIKITSFYLYVAYYLIDKFRFVLFKF